MQTGSNKTYVNPNRVHRVRASFKQLTASSPPRRVLSIALCKTHRAAVRWSTAYRARRRRQRLFRTHARGVGALGCIRVGHDVLLYCFTPRTSAGERSHSVAMLSTRGPWSPVTAGPPCLYTPVYPSVSSWSRTASVRTPLKTGPPFATRRATTSLASTRSAVAISAMACSNCGNVSFLLPLPFAFAKMMSTSVLVNFFFDSRLLSLHSFTNCRPSISFAPRLCSLKTPSRVPDVVVPALGGRATAAGGGACTVLPPSGTMQGRKTVMHLHSLYLDQTLFVGVTMRWCQATKGIPGVGVYE
eukprot:m.958076 g.958076  ORF g.958076 m.958076 type:complete len:301 (+) comp23878_c0_seq3:303-1205(+)